MLACIVIVKIITFADYLYLKRFLKGDSAKDVTYLRLFGYFEDHCFSQFTVNLNTVHRVLVLGIPRQSTLYSFLHMLLDLMVFES